MEFELNHKFVVLVNIKNTNGTGVEPFNNRPKSLTVCIYIWLFGIIHFLGSITAFILLHDLLYSPLSFQVANCFNG